MKKQSTSPNKALLEALNDEDRLLAAQNEALSAFQTRVHANGPEESRLFPNLAWGLAAIVAIIGAATFLWLEFKQPNAAEVTEEPIAVETLPATHGVPASSGE